MSRSGLFIGLATLDLIYLVEALPQSNQKIVALNYTLAAGGPATNAALAFQHLGNAATLAGVVGSHALGDLIRADLAQWGVTIADLNPMQTEPPPASSIFVMQATGDRSIVSMNAVRTAVQITAAQIPVNLREQAIVLIDGHQMAVSVEMARQAKAAGILVAIDGGSWKPGFEQVLPWVDYAVCSASFYPPECRSQTDTIAYLQAVGVLHIAITQGEQPILYISGGKSGEISVPQIQAVDTLGAGDIFHGAFCHYVLKNSFQQALAEAAIVAARSCQFFGTRRWMSA